MLKVLVTLRTLTGKQATQSGRTRREQLGFVTGILIRHSIRTATTSRGIKPPNFVKRRNI